MSMTRINTNTDALLAGANLKKLGFQLSRTMSHLSSGLKLNTAADGPAEIGLMGTFNAQLRGTKVAIQNAEDGLSMMQLADSALTGNMDILLRMRDISVRAATDATLTTTQRQSMQEEVLDLKDEITRRRASITFNGKVLFSGVLSGASLQIGPDNIAAQKLSVQIPLMSVANMAGRDLTDIGCSTITMAQSAMDYIQSAINGLASLQSLVGAQCNAIERTINDLSAAEVNVAAAASRIQDADMATEISTFAKQQVLTMAATAMIAQANAQPQQVLSLLGIGG